MKRSIPIAFVTLLALGSLLGGCGGPDEPTVSWYLAVQRGDIAQVERHIHWNTDINQPFPSGRYPLHEAADKGRIILLKLLLKNQADIDVKDAAGRTPLDLAILNGRTQASEILIREGAHYDPSEQLLLAAKGDAEDRDIVRFLKEHGANLEATDENGDTALLIAIGRNNNRLVHHLVEQGADVDVRNRQGTSALQLSVEIGALEIYQLLIRNGAINTPPDEP